MIKEAIEKVVSKQDLTYDEAYTVMNEIMNGETSQVQNAAYLAALSTKSAKAETIDEISGSAAAMRDHALKVAHDMDVLEIVGTGYRVAAKGNDLEFALGYSHPIVFPAPEGISFAVESPTKFKVVGIDKQQVGEVAANIRKLRKPEPFKGKGVRYEGEVVRRKAGKAGKK